MIEGVQFDPAILPLDVEYSDHPKVTESIFHDDTIIGLIDHQPIIGIIAYVSEPLFCYVMHPLDPEGKPHQEYIELYKLENIMPHEE